MSTMKRQREGDRGDPKTLSELFLGTPVSDHEPRATTGDVAARTVGPVLVVDREESLPRVFRKLATENFLSAPVVENTRYVGFIDMMDLVQKTRELFWGDTVEAWVDFWEKEDRFASCTVDDLMKTPNMYSRDPAPPIGEHYTTFSALELMVRGNYHRLAVVKHKSNFYFERNKLKGIITQSMLISWLRQNKKLLGPLRTTLVSDMVDDLKSRCESVNENSKAINAFTKMASEKISGLAVVDDEGVLTGNISIRDLRGCGTNGDHFYRLFNTVREFKKLAKEDYPNLAPRTHYSSKHVPRRGLFVTPDQTILDVLNKMADGNIHRVFVCNEADQPKPKHVISQVDVLREVLKYISQEERSTIMG